MKIGHAQASLDDRKLDSQISVLRNFRYYGFLTNCGIVGREFVHQGLDAALAVLSKGDALMVCQLDRLGCSLPRLVELVNQLRHRGIGVASLSESIDTFGARSDLFFRVMGALARVEHNMIGERIRVGMHAAHALGRHVGRRRSLSAGNARKRGRCLIHIH
uniref:recombinase family protein n=1 Tax=Caballeronia sp. LjRoot34 TaxID=3342325 RepID=UPI003F4FF19C